MIGAAAGDIAGSRFERGNGIKSKEFELFTPECRFTDDTVMTAAVCRALMKSTGHPERLREEAVKSMQMLGRRYPDAGYGKLFREWLFSDRPEPYGSFGNGSAMRVSACGWAAGTLEEAKQFSREVTAVTHNHPEGLKGAEAVAAAVFLAKTGKTIPEIRAFLTKHYYPAEHSLNEIRPGYRFDSSCQGSVPQALLCFYESQSFEDAVRNAVSLGGDSDTIAAMAGSIAEAFYGVPPGIRGRALAYLTPDLREILVQAENLFQKR